jgi:hypothetical protein
LRNSLWDPIRGELAAEIYAVRMIDIRRDERRVTTVAPSRKVQLLPPSTRERLAAPIHTAVGQSISLTGLHTVPVSLQSWQHYASSLDLVLNQFQAHAGEPPENPNDFVSVRNWIATFLSLRGKLISLTLALRPFEYFQESHAEALISAINELSRCAAEIVETGRPFSDLAAQPPLNVTSWAAVERPHDGEALSRAFGLTSEDLHDEKGEFSPARVFAAYYLKNDKLLQRVMPHLHSLGLPAIVDPLVAVSIVGWIESASDAVGAYCAMDSLFNRLLLKSNDNVLVTALAHLEEVQLRLRLSRVKANRSFATPPLETEMESTVLDLVDGYKRLLEGPVRQYGWLYHCLGAGNWSSPPMLTTLRELLVKEGGWIANVANQMILTEIRNAEAHESLLWDGINELLVTESGTVAPAAVHVAAVKADAFARGCQAAVACYRALSINPQMGGPVHNDPGRSAAWLRAETHFGTNGLHVTKTNFNSKTATISLVDFKSHNVNPCFQALVCSHVLVPDVQQFQIYVDGQSKPIISVSASALKRTQPVWEHAVYKFSSLPLSTFLPANLNARTELEGLSKAVRSVSWIALDDLLDAVDCNPPELDSDLLGLLIERVDLVASATKECLAIVPSGSSLRLRAVNSIAAELLEKLGRLKSPAPVGLLDKTTELLKARHAWDAWGPVPRLPGVKVSSQSTSKEHGPRLRSAEDRNELRWRTI